MRPKPKMLHRLPRVLRSPYQQCIAPRRRPQRQLIQRQTLSSRLLDPSSCSSREPQCRNAHLGDCQKARVICDGADHDDGFVRFNAFRGFGVGFCGRVGGVAGETGERDGWAVDAGHEKAAEDDAVEGAVGAACGLKIVSVCPKVGIDMG